MNTEQLSARVVSLERSVKITRSFLLALLAIIIIGMIGPTSRPTTTAGEEKTSSPKRVTAQEFVLTDGDNNLIAVWSNQGMVHGLPGRANASVGWIVRGPTAMVNISSNERTIGLAVNPAGSLFAMGINDDNGTRENVKIVDGPEVRLALNGKESACWVDGSSISLVGNDTIPDKDGHIRPRIELGLNEGPAIRLRDRNQVTRAAIGVVETENLVTGHREITSESSVTLFTQEGKGLWKAP